MNQYLIDLVSYLLLVITILLYIIDIRIAAVKDSFNAGEFVEKHPKDGFVEDFCLDDERKEQVKLYRLENVSK